MYNDPHVFVEYLFHFYQQSVDSFQFPLRDAVNVFTDIRIYYHAQINK